MRCPKCDADQPDGNQICDRCGIVFHKYFKYHPLPGESAPRGVSQLSRRQSGWHGLSELVLPERLSGGPLALGLRLVLLAVLTVWGLRLAVSPVSDNAAGQSLLHLVNLPFHEFGHILFRPFGSFMTSLGGTLAQLLVPAICLWVLLARTRDPFGAAVALWWLGENFLDIAPYIADARAGQLPLLGGNYGHSAPYGFHDWEFILNESGLLHLDQELARASHLLGSLIMVAALVWAGILLWRHWIGRTRSV